MPNLHLLIVDDKVLDYASFRDAYGQTCVVQFATTPEKGYEYLLGKEKFDSVIFDLEFPPYDFEYGLNKILPEAARLAKKKQIPLLVISSDDRPSTEKKALKLGANAFVSKIDYVVDDFYETLLEVIGNYKKSSAINKRPNETISFVSTSKAMEEIKSQLETLADFPEVSVMLHGESGVGKEALARYAHYYKSNQSRTLHIVNLKSIPSELIASTLFGHVRGAFTDAREDRIGIFEAAGVGGTVLLDEFGDIGRENQELLLTVLSNREFQKVGSNHSIQLKAQVLFATNADLDAKIREGTFRQDIFYRITRWIRIPPLRERREDIEPLIRYFLPMSLGAENHPFRGKPLEACFTLQALEVLKEYYWPGNIRELKSAIQNLVIDVKMRAKNCIDLDMIPHQYRVPYQPPSTLIGLVKVANEPENYPVPIPVPIPVPNSFQGWPSKKISTYMELEKIQTALQNAGGRKGEAGKSLGFKDGDNILKKVEYYFNKFPDLMEHYPYLKKAYGY